MGRPAQLARPVCLAGEQRGPGWGALRNHRASASYWGGRRAAPCSSQSLCRPASLLYGQPAEENRCSCTSGHPYIGMQPGFPENGSSSAFRMLWLAISGFEEHRSSQGPPPWRTLHNHQAVSLTLHSSKHQLHNFVMPGILLT